MGRTVACLAAVCVLAGCAAPGARSGRASPAACHGCEKAGSPRASAYRSTWDRVRGAMCCESNADAACPDPAAREPARPVVESELRRAARAISDCIVSIHAELPSAAARGADTRGGQATLVGEIHSGGTGVIIDADGLILTNEHVVRGAVRLFVTTRDGVRRPAERVFVDEREDLAVIRVTASGLPVAEWPAMARIECGTPVAAVGRAGAGEVGELRSGCVTRVGCSIQGLVTPACGRRYEGLIETSVSLEPGFSGGPLLDEAGRIVGLNVAVVRRGHEKRAYGYAIPLDQEHRGRVEALLARAGR